MFLLKRPAIWFWWVAAVLIPPLGLLVSPAGAYFGFRTEDRTAVYGYMAALFVDALWLSWLLEGTIKI